jgi:hypothetical protein
MALATEKGLRVYARTLPVRLMHPSVERLCMRAAQVTKGFVWDSCPCRLGRGGTTLRPLQLQVKMWGLCLLSAELVASADSPVDRRSAFGVGRSPGHESAGVGRLRH